MEGNARRVIKEHPLVTQGFFDKTDPETGRKYHQSETQGYKIWEYDPITDNYSGRYVRAKIGYVLHNYSAIEKGYVVFTLTEITKIQHGEAQK